MCLIITNEFEGPNYFSKENTSKDGLNVYNQTEEKIYPRYNDVFLYVFADQAVMEYIFRTLIKKEIKLNVITPESKLKDKGDGSTIILDVGAYDDNR